MKWKLTQLCVFPQSGCLSCIRLPPLTYQTLYTHAHLFIAVFLIRSHGIWLWHTAQLHTIHTMDMWLLVANQVLLTPSVSEELTL